MTTEPKKWGPVYEDFWALLFLILAALLFAVGAIFRIQWLLLGIGALLGLVAVTNILALLWSILRWRWTGKRPGER